jgi:hypothetical protein
VEPDVKRLLLVLPIMAVLGTPAGAEVVWVGEAIIKTVNAGCAPQWQVGDFGSAILRPVIPGSDENGTVSRLVFNSKQVTAAHEVNGEFTGDVDFTATLVSASGVVSEYTSNAGILDVSIAPAAFTISSATLRLRGKFTRFTDIAGCTVTLDGVFVKRP